MAEKLFETPNLDGLSVSPDDVDEAAKVFHILAEYAKHKARAMRHRLSGSVNTALTAEQHCQNLYKQLPEWARW